MFLFTCIVSASVLLQLSAAVYALTLIKKTGRMVAWILISSALTLMTIRRIIPLVKVLEEQQGQLFDLTSEIIGLLISIFMITGVVMIGKVFQEIHESRELIKRNEQNFRLMTEVTQKP